MSHQFTAPRRRRLMAGASAAGLGLAAALSASAASALAQEPAAEQPVEVITVTGFRASLQAAIDTKRNETGVVDAIVSDDIADFPDLNLAEAIQRLPGVAIDRDAGEGRQITVRGLSPDFTRVRINGMEALSVTGGTDSSGGGNRSRSFDFNTFASELFQSVVIRKTQSAEVDEGSLGATVDLRAARPFDYRGFTLAGSAQVGWNDLSEEFNPRLAGLIADQTENGMFGWLFSAAYSNRNLLEEGHSTVRWQNATSFGSCSGCASQSEIDAVNNAFHPRIPRYGRLVHEQERLGLTGALQFRPAPSTEINLDVLYSRYDATRSEQFIENFSFSRGGSATPELIGKPSMDVRDFVIDSNNNLIYGVFDNNDIYSEHRYDELTTEFTQVTLSASHEFTDRFRVDGLIGRSESRFDNPVQATILFTNWDAPGFTYDYRQNDRTPAIDWGFDVSDPSNFLLTETRDRPNRVDNTYETAQFNAEFDLNDSITLRGGINAKRYEFDTYEARRDRQFAPGEWMPVTGSMATFVEGFGSGLGMPSGNVTRWAIPDVDAVAAMVGLYGQPLTPFQGNIRNVKEENLGGYGQVSFRSEVGGMPLRGDAGVRVVRTETSSTGIISGVEVTVDNEYTDTLPSLNLALEPTDNIVLRFGAAQVMSRPSLGSLTPGGSVGGTTYTVSYGNPFLDPFRANNYDFSFEWYFEDESVFAAALFYKQIDSFISRATETIPWSQTGLPGSAVAAGSPLANDLAAGIDPLVDVTRNVNGEGGDLHGLEVQYLRPFTFLPGPFDRFGTVLNYTYVDSEVDYGDPGVNQLTGLSRHSYNATLYYEDDRLSARISLNGREKFLTNFPGRNGNDEEGRNSSLNVDAAIRYALTDQVSLTFDGINLTDEFVDQYVDSANRVSVYHHTGREFLFGIRFRY
jgi:iron complex outermembrane recepter protein